MAIKHAVNFKHIALAVAFLLLLSPILWVCYQSLGKTSEAWVYVRENLLLHYLKNTLFIWLGVIILTGFCAIPTAYLVTHYDFFGAKTLKKMLFLPLSLPAYLVVLCYNGIFDYTGIFYRYSPAFLQDMWRLDVKNIWALMLFSSLSLYPYLYVSLVGSFSLQGLQYQESAKTLGLNRFQILKRVVLPMALPALLAGFLLISLELFNDYGAAKYMGIPTLGTAIFKTWFSLQDLQAAAKLAGMLALCIFVILGLIKWLQKGISFEHSVKSKAKMAKKQVGLGKNILYFTLCALPVFLGFILPVTQLVVQILAYHTAIDTNLLQYAWHSLWVAFCGTAVIIFCAFLLAYLQKKQRILYQLGKISSLGYAIPGTILALGVFSLLLTLDGILGFSWFRTGFLGLFWAYIIRFFAVAYQPLQSSMDIVSTRFGDAAASLGKNTKQTLWHIHLPLMRSQLMGVFVLVFVDLVKELPMTLLLRPTRFDTLASKIFEYAEDEMLARTAAPALILIFFGVFALWFNRKKYDF